MSSVLLDALGINVRYGGTAALVDVDFSLHRGEIHALLGENGAGKSTLMKVFAGAVRPDRGTVTLDGQPVQFMSPRDALAAGIRMVHQELRLVPALSVADNIALGREHRFRRIDRARTAAFARQALAKLGPAGASIRETAVVDTLSLAQRQLVEIAKALAGDTGRVLILDEPTAVLLPRESEALFAVVRRLAEAGVGVIYTTHRLEEIVALPHTVTILRDGKRVAHGTGSTFSRADLIRHIVGRDAVATPEADMATPRDRADAPPALALDHISAPGVKDVSFSLRGGELVGLVGLVGAGRTEVAKAIIGAVSVTGGTMALRGTPYTPHSPADAVSAGVGYVPEDRAGSGLILLASVASNLALASLRQLARLGVFASASREHTLVRYWIDRLAIRSATPDSPVRHLSGGNQQKVVLARWLARSVTLLIADEPTRGVDVGARAEIYHALRAVARDGGTVLVITSDLDEALTLCTRLIVMREGRVVGELSGAERTAERVGALMLAS